MKINQFTLIAIMGFLASCSKAPNDGIAVEQQSFENVASFEAVINVSKDLTKTNDIPVDATGYNTKFPTEAEPWTMFGGRYTIGFTASKANIMRYPGGTVANYWDFNKDMMFRTKANTINPATGWINGSINHVPESISQNVVSANTHAINSVADLANVVNTTGCTSMFVMNMTTPGWDFYKTEHPNWTAPVPGDLSTNSTWRKMLDDRYLRFKNMLLRAQGEGIPIKYIELGNELYFFSLYYQQAFPNGTHYATAANYIAGKIKADFPTIDNLKISAVASAESTKPGNTRVREWNNQAVSNFDKSKIGFVSMHSYYGRDESETLNQTGFHNSILAWIDSASYFSNLSDTKTKVYDQNWKVWYTEVFANEDAPRTWANVLINAYTAYYFYQYGNSYIYLQSRFDEQVTNQNELKPRAAGLVPFMEASKLGTKCNRLIFGGGITIGSSQRKALQGYIFEKPDGTTRKAAIINLSNTAHTINMQSSTLFPSGSVTLSGKVNLLNDTDVPDDIPSTTFPSNSIVIQPYSVNYIR